MSVTLNSTGILFNDATQQDTVAYSAFRNRIRNGDMRLDLLYEGSAISHSGGGAGNNSSNVTNIDGYGSWSSGATPPNFNLQRVSFSSGESSIKHALQISGISATGTSVGFYQRIESTNTRDLVNKDCVLSWYANWGGSGTKSVTWTVSRPTTLPDTWVTGSSTTPVGTSIATGTVTLSNSPTRFSAQFNAGANADLGLMVSFNWGSDLSTTYTFTGIQLEKGTVLTPFEIKPYNIEYLEAQRYRPTISNIKRPYLPDGTISSYQAVVGTGYSTGTASGIVLVPFVTQARIPPTSLIGPGTINFGTPGGSLVSLPAIGSGAFVSTDRFGVISPNSTITGAMVANQPIIASTSTSAAKMAFSGAEL